MEAHRATDDEISDEIGVSVIERDLVATYRLIWLDLYLCAAAPVGSADRLFVA